MNLKVVVLTCLKLNEFIVLALPFVNNEELGRSQSSSSSPIFFADTSTDLEETLLSSHKRPTAPHNMGRIVFRDDEDRRHRGRFPRPIPRSPELRQKVNDGNSTQHLPMAVQSKKPTSNSSEVPIPKSTDAPGDQRVCSCMNKHTNPVKNIETPSNSSNATILPELGNFALPKSHSIDCPPNQKPTLEGTCVELPEF